MIEKSQYELSLGTLTFPVYQSDIKGTLLLKAASLTQLLAGSSQHNVDTILNKYKAYVQQARPMDSMYAVSLISLEAVVDLIDKYARDTVKQSILPAIREILETENGLVKSSVSVNVKESIQMVSQNGNGNAATTTAVLNQPVTTIATATAYKRITKQDGRVTRLSRTFSYNGRELPLFVDEAVNRTFVLLSDLSLALGKRAGWLYERAVFHRAKLMDLLVLKPSQETKNLRRTMINTELIGQFIKLVQEDYIGKLELVDTTKEDAIGMAQAALSRTELKTSMILTIAGKKILVFTNQAGDKYLRVSDLQAITPRANTWMESRIRDLKQKFSSRTTDLFYLVARDTSAAKSGYVGFVMAKYLPDLFTTVVYKSDPVQQLVQALELSPVEVDDTLTTAQETEGAPTSTPASATPVEIPDMDERRWFAAKKLLESVPTAPANQIQAQPKLSWFDRLAKPVAIGLTGFVAGMVLDRLTGTGRN